MYPKEVAEQLKKDYIEGLCVMIVCTSVVCFFKMILRIFVLSALSGDVCMKIIKFFFAGCICVCKSGFRCLIASGLILRFNDGTTSSGRGSATVQSCNKPPRSPALVPSHSTNYSPPVPIPPPLNPTYSLSKKKMFKTRCWTCTTRLKWRRCVFFGRVFLEESNIDFYDACIVHVESPIRIGPVTWYVNGSIQWARGSCALRRRAPSNLPLCMRVCGCSCMLVWGASSVSELRLISLAPYNSPGRCRCLSPPPLLSLSIDICAESADSRRTRTPCCTSGTCQQQQRSSWPHNYHHHCATCHEAGSASSSGWWFFAFKWQP